MGGGRILIADDVADNRILLSKILEKLGYEYDIACDGVECIEKYEKEHYDLIFLDIKMPRKSGIEVVKEIRTKYKSPKNQIKVVAITAFKYKEFFDDFHDIGFNDIITKPYTTEKVSNVINYQNIISEY